MNRHPVEINSWSLPGYRVVLTEEREPKRSSEKAGGSEPPAPGVPSEPLRVRAVEVPGASEEPTASQSAKPGLRRREKPKRKRPPRFSWATLMWSTLGAVLMVWALGVSLNLAETEDQFGDCDGGCALPFLPADADSYGTSIHFARNPGEASRLASEQQKLAFFLHVSGNFEESRFT